MKLLRLAMTFGTGLCCVGICVAQVETLGSQHPDHDAAEGAVRAAYRQFSERLGASGIESSVELGDFTTYTREEVKDLRWNQLVSLAPANLRLDRSQRSNYVDGVRTVQFAARWQEPRAMSKGREELAYGPAMAVIEEASETYGQLAKFAAITTYEVSLEVLGRRETYRAAFFWLPRRGTGGYTTYIADPVTDGVEKTLKEPVPLAGEALAKDPARDGLEASVAQQCMAWSSTLSFKKDPPKGTENHVVGAHKGVVTFTNTCSCDVQCRSTCVADTVGADCWDNGLTTTAMHTMAQDTDASTNSLAGALTTGATCAVGFACSYKSCLFGLCGFSVDVTIVNKASVKFTIVGNDGWSVTRPDTYQCSKCDVLPSQPSDAPPIPAGADGGGIYVPENQLWNDWYSGGGGGPLPFAPGGCQWVCAPAFDNGGHWVYDYCWLNCPH